MVRHIPRIRSGDEWVTPFDEDDSWHPPIPASDDELWRYRSLDRYTSILDEGSLWFARADTFGDPFEGSLPEPAFNKWKREFDHLDLNYQHIYKLLQQLTFLNCWHGNTSESVAMWDLFTEGNNGVTIVTSINRLKESLQIEDKEYIMGCVNYIDYSVDDFNIGSTVTPYFHKREGYQHEREFRILHRTSDETLDGGISPDDLGDYIDPGKPVSICVEDLIEEVRINPRSDDGFCRQVREKTRERGYNFPVQKSRLTGKPIF